MIVPEYFCRCYHVQAKNRTAPRQWLREIQPECAMTAAKVGKPVVRSAHLQMQANCNGCGCCASSANQWLRMIQEKDCSIVGCWSPHAHTWWQAGCCKSQGSAKVALSIWQRVDDAGWCCRWSSIVIPNAALHKFTIERTNRNDDGEGVG